MRKKKAFDANPADVIKTVSKMKNTTNEWELMIYVVNYLKGRGLTLLESYQWLEKRGIRYAKDIRRALEVKAIGQAEN